MSIFAAVMKLNELEIGRSAKVLAVGGEGSLRKHLLGMGLIPGAVVSIIGRAPMGGPLELSIMDFNISLREDEAEKIEVEALGQERIEENGKGLEKAYSSSLHEHNAHPGYGESGKYHSKDHAHPLPKGEELSFALVGQQNCGKTTLFNQLTGANQHVGNFPGVTVEQKSGSIRHKANTKVTDLPGIYSLSTYSQEEIVSRNFILYEHPKALINIVDAGNIERHLYLTMQLMELDIPIVLAINMMDELRGNGGAIHINTLERELGIPVVPISAAKGEAIDELVDHAMHIAMYQEKPARQDFCDENDHGGAVHRCLHSIMALIEDHCRQCGLPLRFAASALVEGDSAIMATLRLSEAEQDMVESIISNMEKERGLDRQAAMAEMRYTFIKSVCAEAVVKPRKSKERLRSDKIDKVLTGKWTAIPAFILIMALVFWLTFGLIGSSLQDLLARGVDSLGLFLRELFTAWNVSPAVISLVCDGIIAGVGGVLSFVPIIIVLFFFLSLLEDSGYMARIAYVSDSLLRKIGLSGRSIVPMLIGFGCSVPAVMASRTLPSVHDRKRTIVLIPFMSCSAKIAIYGFFATAFFPEHAALVTIGLYLLGIVIAILVALANKVLRPDSQAAPFMMELPVYRLPHPANVGHLLWDKTKDFVQKAFTVIFVATIVIWFLQSFDFSLNLVSDNSRSILARVAGIVAPVFKPLGLDDWRVVTALISGFLAKESVVSSVEVLGLASAMTPLMAVPMLVFCLLYTPCIAAVSAIRAELGRRWALLCVIFQCVLAWIVAYASYLIAGLFL